MLILKNIKSLKSIEFTEGNTELRLSRLLSIGLEIIEKKDGKESYIGALSKNAMLYICKEQVKYCYELINENLSEHIILYNILDEWINEENSVDIEAFMNLLIYFSISCPEYGISDSIKNLREAQIDLCLAITNETSAEERMKDCLANCEHSITLFLRTNTFSGGLATNATFYKIKEEEIRFAKFLIDFMKSEKFLFLF